MAKQRELVEIPIKPRANKVYYVEEEDEYDDIPYANNFPVRQNRPAKLVEMPTDIRQNQSIHVMERDTYRKEPQYTYNEVQKIKRPLSATLYQQDNRVVPYNRTEPKQKAFVIKDEYGREISRIVSAKKRPNSIHLTEVPPPMQSNTNQYDYAQSNNEIAIQPMQTMTFQQYAVPAVHTIQSVQAVTPMVAPTVASVNAPFILQPTNEYIAEPYHSITTYVSESANPQVYVKTTGSNKIYDANLDDTGRFSTQKKPLLKRKDEKSIDCCSFCDRPRTDVCYFCWRKCSCPIWWTLVIALLVALVFAGAGAVIGLYAGKVITG